MPRVYVDRNNLDHPQQYFERLLSAGRDHTIAALTEIIETYRDGYVLPDDHDAFEKFVTAAEIQLARLQKL